MVSKPPRNCPAAPPPLYEHCYRRRILSIAPAAPQPQPPPPRHFCHMTTATAAPTASAAPLLPFNHRYRPHILTIAPDAPQLPPPCRFGHTTTATAAAIPAAAADHHPITPNVFLTFIPKGQTDRDEGIVAFTSCRSVTDLAAYYNTCVGETFFSPPSPFH